ncbi:hypothetical protein LMH87_011250 [Akanthomyces muscarius]|uniref:Uncharacterized protein n=1 Tax=Akanthomyces muscarius TaxID=2231603 RepID=A0A9W8UJS5_AKAMU|nr:hypothetical protein LMH87_011250 [Akanthomyces muscarius]KAJ4150502.1 hypothetical protein LMH87_011250 [Akanthomyces muscarius]
MPWYINPLHPSPPCASSRQQLRVVPLVLYWFARAIFCYVVLPVWSTSRLSGLSATPHIRKNLAICNGLLLLAQPHPTFHYGDFRSAPQ